MPTQSLTDVTVRTLALPPSGQVTYWDTTLPGFGVRVSKGGTKSFVLVHGTHRRRTTIGRYPTVSLKEARLQARKLLAQKALGIEERQSQKITFAEVRARFLAACKLKNRPRTVEDYRRRLDRHFKFGDRKLEEISRDDIQKRLAAAKDTPAEQLHAFVAMRTMLNWAVREDLLDTSPISKMRPPSTMPSRERVLSDAELSALYKAAREHPYPFGPIVSLLILTGQRRGEIAALRWDWINDTERTITLPASIAKNRRTHTFPYGDHVAEILAGLPRFKDCGLLFSARSETEVVFNGWGKCKARLDAEVPDVEHYTLHDLRRTFASNLARLGTPIHVTEKLLNHISGTISGVAAIYNRHTYSNEMRMAAAEYERHLKELMAK